MQQLSNRQVRLVRYPEDVVRDENFEIVDDVPVRDPAPGELLVKVRYVSIEAAMRLYMDPRSIIATNPDLAWTFVRKGDVVRAWIVGEVIGGESARFPIGSLVRDIHGGGGVQRYTILREDELSLADPALAPLPAFLGVLGMVGLTAYAGMIDVGRPRPGETVVVTGAAGGVGGLAGQIAAIAGCRVIGVAGGADKCAHVTGELGFDGCIDHRAGTLDADLAARCPGGIDIVFDNIGGGMLDTCLGHLATASRVIACGAVAAYNGDIRPLHNYLNLLTHQARYEAFSYYQLAADRPRYDRAQAQLGQWLAGGRLRHEERMFDGLEGFVPALRAVYDGSTTGKVMLRLPE